MYTRHAETRCQQRGIRGEVVETLLDFGRCRTRHGAEVYFMDRAARERARTVLGRRRYSQVADRLDAYVVVGEDGQVITAAKRLGRLKFR